MNDKAQLALGFDKKIRMYAATTTNLCEHARYTHGLWPTTAQILGRTLTATALMSLMDKNHASVSVRIDADGPSGKVTTEGKHGVVRGYINNPEVFFQHQKEGLTVKNALGTSGFINVTKKLNNGTFYTSTSPIVSGEIADDFTYYFTTSEQTPSSVGLGMIVETDNSVSAAGGFIIQVMPGASDEVITFLEDRLETLRPFRELLQENLSPKEIITEVLGSEALFLDEYELSYQCNCSDERFYEGVKTIGKTELTNILNEDEKVDITCNFCKKEYHFTSEQLSKMIEELE